MSGLPGFARWTLAAALAIAGAGCLPDGVGPGGDPHGGGGGGGSVDYRAAFNANVKPILEHVCSGCHATGVNNALVFMDPAKDLLDQMLALPGLIGATPETSRIYVKGSHSGPALTDAQKATVGDWIVLYNANRAMPDGGATMPTFKPIALDTSGTKLTTIDLGMVKADLAGDKLSFTASVSGGLLKLGGLSLAAGSASGIHIKHPVFILWDSDGKPHPDAIDSFADLDMTVAAGATESIAPGQVFLSGYTAPAQLSVLFYIADKATGGGPDGGVVTMCKSLSTFLSTVKPVVTGQSGINITCTNCHVTGGSGAGAFPLTGVTSADAGQQGMACFAARGELDLATPANSMLIKKVSPGATHQGGTLTGNALTTFTNAVTTWAKAEK